MSERASAACALGCCGIHGYSVIEMEEDMEDSVLDGLARFSYFIGEPVRSDIFVISILSRIFYFFINNESIKAYKNVTNLIYTAKL